MSFRCELSQLSLIAIEAKDGIYKRKPGGGRKPMDPRNGFEGIVFVLRTVCQWKALPKKRFGSASSVHKYFRQWLKAGFFLEPWRAGICEYDEMESIAWKWQSLVDAMVKVPLAQEAVGPNPTDRGKGICWWTGLVPRCH